MKSQLIVFDVNFLNFFSFFIDILCQEFIVFVCVSYYVCKMIEDVVCCLIYIWLEQKEVKGCMKKKNKVLK